MMRKLNNNLSLHCLDVGMSDEEMDHCVTIRELALPGCRYVR